MKKPEVLNRLSNIRNSLAASLIASAGYAYFGSHRNILSEPFDLGDHIGNTALSLPMGVFGYIYVKNKFNNKLAVVTTMIGPSAMNAYAEIPSGSGGRLAHFVYGVIGAAIGTYCVHRDTQRYEETRDEA